MIFESIYTSSDKNFVSGRVGFSTIAHTEGMSSQLIQRLEHLSLYPRRNTEEDQSFSPSVYFHLWFSSGSQTYHVLSRIVDCGFDYTGRTNYLAHHFVLTEDELPSCGPAAFLMSAPFLSKWDSGPKYLPLRDKSFFQETGTRKTVSCPLWQKWSGDPYWSLSLFEKLKQKGKTYVVIDQNIPLLQLFDESLTLLVPKDRWKIPFCTCFIKFPVDILCTWQGVYKESMNIERTWFPNANIVNLTISLPEYFQHTPELIPGSIRLDSYGFEKVEKPEKTENNPVSIYETKILNIPSAHLKFPLTEPTQQQSQSSNLTGILDYGNNPYEELYSDDLDNTFGELKPEIAPNDIRIPKPLPIPGQNHFDQLKTASLKLKRNKKSLFNKIFYSLILFIWIAIVVILFVLLLSFFTSCQLNHSISHQIQSIQIPKSSVSLHCADNPIQPQNKPISNVLFSIPFQGDFIWP
ncbi:MAG: hypothetical protein Q4C95_03365 [Planctomycetia bacterium]|nr:hypothetical protein [Planctomycetia bacterium]